MNVMREVETQELYWKVLMLKNKVASNYGELYIKDFEPLHYL